MAKKDSVRATSAGGNENRQNTSPDNDETTYLTAEDRTQRIAVSAYYRAQRRGFEGAEALDDWLAAEREIDSSEGGRGVKHEVSVRSAAIENLEAEEGAPPSGPDRIEPEEVKRWAQTLSVSAPELREAIRRVGPLIDDVRQFLSTSSTR